MMFPVNQSKKRRNIFI